MLLSLLWTVPHREGKLGEERLPLAKSRTAVSCGQANKTVYIEIFTDARDVLIILETTSLTWRPRH